MDADDLLNQVEPTAAPRCTDLGKWAARLSLVSEVARATHSRLEAGELLEATAQAIQRHFGYYDVSIFVVDREAGECVLAAQAGSFPAQGVTGYRQKIGAGIVGWVAQQGRTLLANDVRREPRYLAAFPAEEQSLSELAVPVRLGDRTVGVINVENREANAFDESDVMALEILADQVAQAMANAQLFERTRLLRDLNRAVIDAMPSGLCVVDGGLKVVFVNPSFCRLFGCREDGAAGRPVSEVLPPGLLKEAGIESAIQLALKEKGPQVFADVAMGDREGQRLLNVRVAPASMPEGPGVVLTFEDVTEWRKAMTLAEERRSLLDLILSHVPAAVVSCDREGRFTYWDADAERLSGYTEREMLGRVVSEELLEEAATLRALVETCDAEGVAEGELTLRRKDGGTVPVLLVLGRLLDRSGRHAGYTAVLLDITKRRRAEQDLLREKQKLEDVVSVVGAGLALIDRQRRIVWANRKLREWFGAGEEVVGRRCHQVYCRRDTVCAECPAETSFTTGRPAEAMAAYVRPDGALRQYHHATTPIVGPSGQVEQVLKLTLDVTEEKKKVYQLARLRQLGQLMQGVLDLDRLLHYILTCVTAGQALGFNRAILLMVDRDRNVIEGKMGVGPASAEEAAEIWSRISEEAPTLEDLLARSDAGQATQPTAMNLVARSISVPLEETDHIVARCALDKAPLVIDDATRDPRVSREFADLLGARQFVLAPLIAHNQPVGVIVADNLYTGQPITQEHVELLCMFANQAAIAIENARMYEQLQEEKAHLEQAYRDLADTQDKLLRTERLAAMGRMDAHVTHEIRNPLVTIGGFAHAIRRRPASPDSARYAEIIAGEVRRLENILARVMDFTKPPTPILREAPLGAIIRETLEQLRPRAEEQGVEVQTHLPQPDLLLHLDPEQMKQVFFNLFKNALEAMKDGGLLSVGVDSDEEVVRVVVADTGEPIPAENLPNLFEPFFTTKPGGTGLGLTVSQKIVQDHGGDITVASSLERGTEFIVTLPRRK